MEGLNELEQAVLNKLLAGDEPVLVLLRKQVEAGRLVSRENSGAGFFCLFQVPSSAPLLPTQRDFHFGDVNAVIAGLEYGAGFVLFVKGGRLDTLEGYSYEETWPKEVRSFELSYQHEPRQLQLPELPPKLGQ